MPPCAMSSAASPWCRYRSPPPAPTLGGDGSPGGGPRRPTRPRCRVAAWLQGLPAPDGERDRFVRQLVMARVADVRAAQDTAVHLLGALETNAQRFGLAT
ncbi:type VI secretion system domain-containing protein [Cupriavidus basilensis]